MKISTVSKQSGISADTLRYYERIGLLPEVIQGENGPRPGVWLDSRIDPIRRDGDDGHDPYRHSGAAGGHSGRMVGAHQ